MILVRLEGGLGNQMFQYALGRKLSLRSGTELLLNTELYTENMQAMTKRHYGLSHFNICARIATAGELREIAYPHGIFFHKLYRRFERTVLRRCHIKFEPDILRQEGDISLEGFWQSEKYFKDIRGALLEDFSLKEPLSPEAERFASVVKKERHTVSLHVRRTDYVANEKSIRFYGKHCDQRYYSEALSEISRKAKADDLHVFVFSDDIQWVKENLDIPYAKTYISETSAEDYERMVLMSLCKHHIIANSTFSWWGAWLDSRPDKIVVAPSVWIPGIDLPVSDIIPAEWIKL